jgi:hypothetical protein
VQGGASADPRTEGPRLIPAHAPHLCLCDGAQLAQRAQRPRDTLGQRGLGLLLSVVQICRLRSSCIGGCAQ